MQLLHYISAASCIPHNYSPILYASDDKLTWTYWTTIDFCSNINSYFCTAEIC